MWGLIIGEFVGFVLEAGIDWWADRKDKRKRKH